MQVGKRQRTAVSVRADPDADIDRAAVGRNSGANDGRVEQVAFTAKQNLETRTIRKNLEEWRLLGCYAVWLL
jgi:hypothetical protein